MPSLDFDKMTVLWPNDCRRGGEGWWDPYFFLDICSSLVERSLHAKFQLPRLPRSGSSMVGDKQQKTKDNSVELEASLAPAEAEVGAVAKADQQIY